MRVFLSLPQLALFFWRVKYRALAMALACALVALSYAGSRPVEYRMTASFRDQSNARNRVGLAGGTLTLEQPDDEDSSHVGPMILMRSRVLLDRLVGDLKLQASITEHAGSGFWSKLMGFTDRLHHSVSVELARQSNDPSWLPKERPPPIQIDSITYTQHSPLHLALRFVSDVNYLVSNANGELIGQGQLNTAFSDNGVSFTLSAPPSAHLMGKQFRLKVHPMWQLVKQLREEVAIASDPEANGVYELTFEHHSPALGTRLLNGLVDTYIGHLRAEAEKKAAEKLAFLENRKREMMAELQEFLGSSLPPSALGDGPGKFLDYETQAKVLSQRQEQFSKALTSLELRLQSLGGFLDQGYAFFPQTLKEIPELEGLLAQTRALEQQRDGLHFDLQQVAKTDAGSAERVAANAEEIERVEHKIAELNALIVVLDKPTISLQAALKAPLIDLPKRERRASPFLEHLKNARRQHEIRAKVLRSRLAFEQMSAPDFSGLNLPIASRIYDETHALLDSTLEALRNHEYALEHLADPLFAVSSLSGTLVDPVSASLIQEASALANKIANDAYYTNKA